MRYLVKRLLSSLSSLFVIVSITFFLMKAIPGDPFTEENALPQEILTSLYEHYKLNDPWYVQYGNYLTSVAQWRLGPSFKYKDRSVNDIIKSGFPISALLGLEAMFIAISIGILLGSYAALYQNQWQGWIAMSIAVIGISVPSFVLATVLQYLFSIKLHLLPVARWGGFSHTILPALSLAALPCAFIARLVRASMIEIFTMDYIKTARSKGLHIFTVTVKHAIKNAILPVITYLGMITTNILTGSFIIERIFGIPGLGGWFISSVTNRDYTVIMGITVFYSLLRLSIIFFVDLLYVKIDPRIKLQE